MTDRFVRRLHQFARAADNIDLTALQQIEGAFYDYMSKAVRACYYEVCIESSSVETGATAGTRPTLRTFWCSKADRRDRISTLFDRAQEYYSQKAYAFGTQKRLWITASKKDAYLKDNKNLDQIKVEWQEADDIPPYTDYDDDGDAKTSILFPLMYSGQCIGVVDIELPRQITPSKPIKEHVAQLAEALSVVLGRFRSTSKSMTDTREAFQDLLRDINFLEDCGLPEHKPTIFFSFAEDADREVVGCVFQVLKDHYANDVSVHDWRRDTNPGLIVPEIVNRIAGSRFGVCYLSERCAESEKAGITFLDNPNVLFEAGMMHALRHNRGESLEGWLPIRENENLTSQVPFNFAGDRILIVPRSNDGQLNRDLFAIELKAHLDRLFGLHSG